MAGSKAINVKIATPKIIKALEGALAKLELDYTSQEANEAKYEQELELWKKKLPSGLLITSQMLKTLEPTIVLTTEL